jgi:hypothetical protein
MNEDNWILDQEHYERTGNRIWRDEQGGGSQDILHSSGDDRIFG